MALKLCKECKKEYSDTLEACPHCGFREDNTVVIYGYTETFAVNPAVEITKDEALLATVSRNSKVELEIAEPCELKFKSSFRTTRCMVKPGDAVVLSFNRMTGSLNATVTSKENSATEINIKKGKDGTRIIWAIILIIALFAISASLG
ncbi:MAG: hypothetical protein E7115_06540 [Bacteroidales bacterium]|nr:hypothetical protein [Bacteroidales bacterium]